jgi:hypothetical protein
MDIFHVVGKPYLTILVSKVVQMAENLFYAMFVFLARIYVYFKRCLLPGGQHYFKLCLLDFSCEPWRDVLGCDQ